ncbi:MAG TPA: alpha/beta hydrolase [Planctomycetota bacterium]|nr:alpha/beta hydrolase [Planctomycetota bacterium]
MHPFLRLAAAVPFTAFAVAQQKPPPPAEIDALIAKFFAADDKTSEGHTERASILDKLAAVPPLDAAQTTAWQGKIQKAWGKGKKLEKAGDNWFWPEDKKKKTAARGRYIVGGENKKPKGLAINMHGGGAGAGDAGSAAGAYEGTLAKLGLLMIAPEVLEKTEHGWTDSGTEEFVLDLLDAALRTWKVDPDKVFFVGHSMGGYGSWTLGGHHADRVAAIAPSAGAPTPVRTAADGPIIDVKEGVIPSLRNVFVSIYQSLDDVQVPPEPNQVAAKLLAEAAKKWGGFEHTYWEVNGRGHAEPPGGYEAQLDKVVKRTRTAVPDRIVWQPVLAWKRQFHWLYWDSPVANAIVVADLDRKANTVVITCDKPTTGLHVLLDARVLDLAREVVVTVNGAETFRGKAVPSLGTLLRTSDHPDPELQFIAQVPAFAKTG